MKCPDDAGFPDATTVSVPRVREPEHARSCYVVTIVEGPDQGASFTVEGTRPSPMLLGTSPACDIRLTDRHASRRHAAVEVTGRHVRIRDLESTNGTYVDGLRVGEAFLRGGETVRIGVSALRIDEGTMRVDAALPDATGFGKVIGSSLAMRRLYPLCARLAATDIPVVIEGETGTGKEHLAEALHAASARAQGPFVVFDCTAVSPSLIESELFGHERGAFTGAVGTRKGVFERAHGGTLLIDEIGDMPLELQPKLLRAIERSEITRVGGARAQRVDVRILSATRRNLDREAQEGRFRDDLFHRIAVTRIEIPPLRRRQGDVSMLAKHFCALAGTPTRTLPASLLTRWESYDWLGNVRELRNAVARWMAIGDIDDAGQDEAPGPARTGGAVLQSNGDTVGQVLALDLPLAEARQRVVEAFEQRYVERLLEIHGGNVTRAAAAAGVARRHLHRMKARTGSDSE